MNVLAGSTDVTTHFQLENLDGTDATGLTITDLDLQYTRSGATPAAKVDATALGAANSAHSDNYAIEMDPTDQPGAYRVDWPDAAFAAGVREVILTVKHTAIKTCSLRVNLTPVAANVQVMADSVITPLTFSAETGLRPIRYGTAQGGAANEITLDAGASAIDDSYVPTTVVIVGGTGAGQWNVSTDYDGTSKDLAVLNTWLTNPDNTSVFALFPAAMSPADIAAAVWTAASRTLTALDDDDTTIDLDATLVAAVLDLADGIETGLTLRQALRLIASATAGKASGGGTGTMTYRNAVADSKDRIVATVAASGRSEVTVDLT